MKKRQLMGIINCTPDSYFEGGRFTDPMQAIEYGLKLVEEGADILDIGGESTSPRSVTVREEEELKRVIPVIKGIRQKTDCPISIDTYKPFVAKAALDAGANIINDVTALSHPEMQTLAIEKGVKCCLMHMYAPVHTQLQTDPVYPEGVVNEICRFFKEKVEFLINRGLDGSQIILDPGIGGGAFGKTPDQSLQIIKNIKQFTALGFPILIGLSRKSFLQKIFRKQATDVLSTTLALNTMALLEGATYIRVHDVAAHRDIITILEKMDGLNS